MLDEEPQTQSLEFSEVEGPLSDLIRSTARGQTRVLIENQGIPVAAVVSMRDFERWQMFERQRAERFKILDELREAFKDVPDEEIERETARIIERNREAAHAARNELATTP